MSRAFSHVGEGASIPRLSPSVIQPERRGRLLGFSREDFLPAPGPEPLTSNVRLNARHRWVAGRGVMAVADGVRPSHAAVLCLDEGAGAEARARAWPAKGDGGNVGHRGARKRTSCMTPAAWAGRPAPPTGKRAWCGSAPRMPSLRAPLPCLDGAARGAWGMRLPLARAFGGRISVPGGTHHRDAAAFRMPAA